MKMTMLAVALSLSAPAFAQNPWDIGKKALGGAAASKLEEQVNKRLLAEDIVAVGAGPSRPLVKSDDTPAKKAKNRRYEIQVRL